MKNKEEAKEMFYETIKSSWTYHRLTDEEIVRFEKIVERVTNQKFYGCIKGTFDERYQQLMNIYYAFLVGVGYSDECIDWRGETTI